MHRTSTIAGVIACLAVAALSPLRALAAQNAPASGTIVATVQDSSGAGIANAELIVDGTATRGVTDEHGELRLTSVPLGPARLTVRRLGFRPITVRVTVGSGAPATTTVRLVQIAQALDPILVRGSAHAYRLRMGGFYDRRSRGFGHFITRADLERVHPLQLTDMFRRVPGVRIVSTNTIQNAVRMRGEMCPPLVWIDGAPAAAAEFDLDAITPESVEGIEVYNGLSAVPIQFMPPFDVKACGVVVVWSRQGEPREKKPKKGVTPTQLAELVASLKVYTADEVDVPARPDTADPAEPLYPESLFLNGTNGKVTAEFVVDTTGRVSMETFNAISSTDPAFTTAVRRALADASYVPAMLQGHRVKQVVHQPFTFVIDPNQRRSRP
jgi:TonB family protein